MTKIKVQLPEQAIQYIDKKADEILLLLSPEPKRTAQSPKPAISLSQQPIDHVSTDKDNGETTRVGTIDGFGNKLSRYFPTERGNIGLTQENYPLAEQFADKLSSRKELSNYISPDFALDVLFDWFKAKYTGALDKTNLFTTFLIEQIYNHVDEQHVAIPISFLAIDHPFSLGKVKFDFFDKNYFDRFEQAVSKNFPNEPPRELKEEREEYQGIVFAHLNILAEQTRALSLAIELTDQSLSVLRLFSPSVFFPEIRSYFGRKGNTIIPINHFFVFNSEWPIIVTKVAIDGQFRFDITDEFLTIIRPNGLDNFDQLLNQSGITDLEESLLDSLNLFSKAISSADLHDRLIFLFACIESLLLRDSGEPIQKTVGQRLAFLLFTDPHGRQSVATFINKAYSHRSGYVHHGERQQILDIAVKLSHLISSAILAILRRRNKFTTKIQFIDDIEMTIFS